MTETNHVTTGALIAVVIDKPVIALPLALLSHFVLDAIPHYGYEGSGYGEAFKHRALYVEQAVSLTALVFILFMIRDQGFVVYLAGLIALLPDFMWPYRYFFFERVGKTPPGGPITKFHQWVQWWEKPAGIVPEIIIFAVVAFLLLRVIK